MVKALIEGKPLPEVLNLAGRLRASRADLFEALQPEELRSAHRFVLSEIMAPIEELEARIGRFEHALLGGLAAWQPPLVLLQTIPGIDRVGADMQRFGRAEKLASRVGICPGNNESAGKRKSGKTRKGNAWVRRLLCEFAQAAARSRCALQDKFAALSIRKRHKKPIVALAHKMLRLIFAVLKNNTAYRDRVVDYEALSVQRNAPRWIKMLVKHGFIPASASAFARSTSYCSSPRPG